MYCLPKPALAFQPNPTLLEVKRSPQLPYIMWLLGKKSFAYTAMENRRDPSPDLASGLSWSMWRPSAVKGILNIELTLLLGSEEIVGAVMIDCVCELTM
jgi:hypothetical protein